MIDLTHWLSGAWSLRSPFRARTPAWLLVERRLGKTPECVNGAAISHNGGGREQRSGRLGHEGHKLIRKTGHSAADTDAAYIGAAADSRHPSAFSYVALNHRTPASQFHDASDVTVLIGKFSLFIIAAAVAAFVNCGTEEPARPQPAIERNHRGQSRQLIKQVKQGFGKIIGLNRAAGHAHNRNA